MPNDMIAIGEFEGFGFPAFAPYTDYHGRGRNAVFCDGHVESSNPDRIPKIASTLYFFKPDEAHAKRWNNDNQPHPETWPQY